MKILITGHHNFHNKGCEALIYTTIELLRNVFPGAHFTAVSLDPTYDNEHFNNGSVHSSVHCNFIKYGFQINEFTMRNRLWFFLNYYTGVNTDRILRTSPVLYEAVKSCDLMVVSGGDILADYGEAGIKHAFFPVAVAIALKKPVYVFAQSFSRYQSNELLNFARSYLNRVSLITVRERHSFAYLKEIGIKSSFHLTSDPAFLLRPCSNERLQEILQKERLVDIQKPLIGISVSKTATKWSETDHQKFLGIIADVCDRLIDKYNVHIVFISHVTDTHPENDDKLVADAVRIMMRNLKSATVIKNEYTCSELKALIGACDLFIGARTHATIASTSQGVPTIALAYSTKAFGIMEDIVPGSKGICDVRTLSRDDLLEKAVYFLDNGTEVSHMIRKNYESVRERALLNGQLALNIKFNRGDA